MILSNVNIGTGPSAGDGDPLRSAFNTINQNFARVQSNVNALTNSVSSVAGRTGNVTLTTQDIVGINNYATISYVTSQVANAAAANISSLQSNVAALQADVNTLYGNAGVQSATLATLTANAASQAGSLTTLTANAASQAGELTTLLSNAAVQAGEIASLLSNAGSQHEAISSLQANVSTLFANAGAQSGTLTTLTSNAAVQAGLIADIKNGVATFGNVIPSANVTYSLGNITHQWKELWVSGNTIHLGGAQLSVSGGVINTSLPIAGNVQTSNLTVTGANISFSNGAYIEETEIVGNPGYYGLALNSSDDGIVGLNAIDSNSEISSSVIVSNVQIQLNVANSTPSGNALVWLFDQSGSITFPDGTSQNTAGDYGNVDVKTYLENYDGDINFNGGSIRQVLNEDFRIRVSDDEVDGWALESIVDDGNGVDLTKTSVQYNQFSIHTDLAGGHHQWNFQDNGQAYFPGAINGPTGSNFAIRIGGQLYAAPSYIDIETRSPVGDAIISQIRVSDPNVTIGTASTAYKWTFTEDNKFVVPQHSVITTANANGGLGGNTISIIGGASDAVTWNSNPGGNVDIQGGYGSFADGGGGNGGDVNIQGGGSSDAQPGRVVISSNTNKWVFDNTGTVTVPGAINLANGQAVTAPSATAIKIRGSSDSSGAVFDAAGEAEIYANTNVYIYSDQAGSQKTWNFTQSGNLIFPDNTIQTTAAGNISARNFIGNVVVGNIRLLSDPIINNLIYSVGGPTYITAYSPDSSYRSQLIMVASPSGSTLSISLDGGFDYIFSETGLSAGSRTITTTGNISAGGVLTDNYYYANGTPVSFGGSSYSNVEVATYLPTYTGNISAGNITVSNVGGYKLGSGSAKISTDDNTSILLTPDTGANALAGVKIGGNGYLLGPNGARNITLNYGGSSGAVGLQANVTVGSAGSGNLTVNGTTTTGNLSTAGSILSSGVNGKIGYSSGGYVVQSGNASGITLNTISGNIKLDTVNIAVNTTHTVALTSNKLDANDIILVQGQDTNAIDLHIGAYYLTTNTAVIYLRNISGSSIGPIAPTLKFIIVKAPSA